MNGCVCVCVQCEKKTAAAKECKKGKINLEKMPKNLRYF